MKDRHHILYKTWWHMKNRCDNSKHMSYKNYGARGIKYTSRWSNFKLFLEDMGFSYKKGLFLDRIDNNKGYCKENCRWVTRKENNNNKRNNRILIFNGIRKNLTQWSEYLGIKRSTLNMRINKYNLPLEKAFKMKGGEL